MSRSLDPRRNAYRADLADERLAGSVSANRFVASITRQVIAPVMPVRRHPRPNSPLDTEALFGEIVHVFEETGEGWSWVQLADDGYVGYAPSAMLGDVGGLPSHKVSVLRTFLYPGPNIKLPPEAAISLGAKIAVHKEDPPFFILDDGLAVIASHLSPLDWFADDFVAVAERFLGVPYLWGGKSSLGLDCSGLLQLACLAVGIAAPRDTDMQEAELGDDIGTEIAGLRRGDLVFWKGHVGIMRDEKALLHANAHHMMVASEPLAEAVARIGATGLPITRIRRVPSYRATANRSSKE
ncbi:MAG: C40 family peptidase [Hyphomicrobiales bacterium]|nr:C40 family peptidase [Hyphomicrobiales bacterium]